MIEPITIGAIITALIVKSQDKAVDAAVDGGSHLLGGLVDRLRGLFSGDDEDAADRTALEQAVAVPDSPSRLATLATALDTRAERDPAFLDALRAIADEAASDGVEIRAIVQQIHGDQNVQATNNANSSITVNYGTKP